MFNGFVRKIHKRKELSKDSIVVMTKSQEEKSDEKSEKTPQDAMEKGNK